MQRADVLTAFRRKSSRRLTLIRHPDHVNFESDHRPHSKPNAATIVAANSARSDPNWNRLDATRKVALCIWISEDLFRVAIEIHVSHCCEVEAGGCGWVSYNLLFNLKPNRIFIARDCAWKFVLIKGWVAANYGAQWTCEQLSKCHCAFIQLFDGDETATWFAAGAQYTQQGFI